MPRAAKTNGHKHTNIEDIKMNTVIQADPIAPPSDISWDEALTITGCKSQALLVMRLAPLVPDVDIDALTSIPLIFKAQLDEIRQQVETEESTKRIGASSAQKSPKDQAELPSDLVLIEVEDTFVGEPASISSTPPSTPTGPKSKDHRKKTSELAAQRVKETAKAKRERLAREKAEKEAYFQRIQEEVAAEALEEYALRVEAREIVLTALNDRQFAEDANASDQNIAEINDRLSKAGTKLRISSADEIAQKQQEYVAREQEHQDFFATIASAWESD